MWLPNQVVSSGLAVDLALKRDNIDFICPDFPYQGICNDFRNKHPMALLKGKRQGESTV